MSSISKTDMFDYKDKRDENGTLLQYSAFALAADVLALYKNKRGARVWFSIK